MRFGPQNLPAMKMLMLLPLKVKWVWVTCEKLTEESLPGYIKTMLGIICVIGPSFAQVPFPKRWI